MSNNLDSEAVQHFKEYLRIPSVSPNCDYKDCVKFLKNYAVRLGLVGVVHEVAAKKPVVVISWPGSQPELPSILLSSHMDVVPVFADKWTHEPFGAEEDEIGNIYARGAQDMKCVGIQYLEAVYRLILQGYQPKRSVHICFTPDEEVGLIGMRLFLETEAFKKLNVGCALDEGIASTDNKYNLYYGERTFYRQKIICSGTSGHGSLMCDNTAGDKVNVIINKFMVRRQKEKKKLVEHPSLTLGDVTTINLTRIEGGVQTNVVPPEMTLVFDCRLSHSTDLGEFKDWVKDVCAQAGKNVRIDEYVPKRAKPEYLDSRNPWWMALKNEFERLDLKVGCHIFPAGSDTSLLRLLGIPAFGFSPINNTPELLHAHDEFLNVKTFLKGIEIYKNIIPTLANT